MTGALIVDSSLAHRVAHVFAAGGFRVEREPAASPREGELPGYAVLCRSKEGAAVLLRFARFESLAPGEMVVIFGNVSSLRAHLFRRACVRDLAEAIDRCLRENGATEYPTREMLDRRRAEREMKKRTPWLRRLAAHLAGLRADLAAQRREHLRRKGGGK